MQLKDDQKGSAEASELAISNKTVNKSNAVSTETV